MQLLAACHWVVHAMWPSKCAKLQMRLACCVRWLYYSVWQPTLCVSCGQKRIHIITGRPLVKPNALEFVRSHILWRYVYGCVGVRVYVWLQVCVYIMDDSMICVACVVCQAWCHHFRMHVWMCEYGWLHAARPALGYVCVWMNVLVMILTIIGDCVLHIEHHVVLTVCCAATHIHACIQSYTL